MSEKLSVEFPNMRIVIKEQANIMMTYTIRNKMTSKFEFERMSNTKTSFPLNPK